QLVPFLGEHLNLGAPESQVVAGPLLGLLYRTADVPHACFADDLVMFRGEVKRLDEPTALTLDVDVSVQGIAVHRVLLAVKVSAHSPPCGTLCGFSPCLPLPRLPSSSQCLPPTDRAETPSPRRKAPQAARADPHRPVVQRGR